MSGIGSTVATTTFTYPNFDLGLGRRKKSLQFDAEQYQIGVLHVVRLFKVSSIGAGVANTTIQDQFTLPGRVKIPKIMVSLQALNALTGHSFNIVFGVTAAYTPSVTTIPGNDNSGVPSIGYNAQGQPTGATSPTYPSGGGGFCTNPALPGNTFFSADVTFNATNFPGNPNGGNPPGTTAIPAITTTAGTGSWGQFLVPANPDAVWPQGAVLTLRTTTPASTGSITTLEVTAFMEIQPLSATYPSSQQLGAYVPVMGIDV